ncbi:hypothetical protein [Flavobacterium sp. GSP6]|uniref:hypothetical protein n=1 Tax=Flavobacterium sp. GSP6 TaxID=2497488 RepID=UPI000F888459|nr:hypothetical protein [Flavobacterium sp. GSP6]RTZ01765.1 hypothetical protein EKM03_14780 [Flavobacterium sp. GSP6]
MKNKIIISIIFLTTFISFDIVAQHSSKGTSNKNCNYKTQPNLNESISCDTTLFQNGSKLYRQFNCDSSWLTFENKNGLKKIMYSLDKPLIELTSRLGYQFVKEYKTTLLFENRQASGGGFPTNFELIDKDNGKVIEEFGTIIYYSDTDYNNYVLYLSSDSLVTLTFYNIDTKTKFNYSIPQGRLRKTVMESSQMFPEYLFEEPQTNDNILTLKYKYLVNADPEKWNTDIITIDLQKIKADNESKH